jgi:cardiolipin synthase
MTEGNEVKLLVNGGAAYSSMLEAIEEAEDTINLETYIFASDATGRRFAAAISERAREGLEVNLLLDSLGSAGLDAEIEEQLTRAGVRLAWYRPLAPWRQGWGWWRRDHKKILVVDGRVGFVGGMNIGDDYADPSAGGRGWRDTQARLRGPVVRQLQLAFMHTWRKAGGIELLQQRHLRDLGPQGEAPAVILTNGLRRQRRQIHRAYLHALKRARDYIYITNPYFAPDIGIRRRLRSAARRGVDVRILLAGESSDVLLATLAARHTYARLLRCGVRIFEWLQPTIHAKTAVVDGAWATVGSCNLDMLSLRHNLESNVVVLGSHLACPLRDQFLLDTDPEHAAEIRPDHWRYRPLGNRLLEWLAFGLRRFL